MITLSRITTFGLALFLSFALPHAASATSAEQTQMATEQQKQVNVNTASEQELAKVEGLGAKHAASIVKYREKNGAFKSISDLSKVPGMGPRVMKRVQDRLAV